MPIFVGIRKSEESKPGSVVLFQIYTLYFGYYFYSYFKRKERTPMAAILGAPILGSDQVYASLIYSTTYRFSFRR